MRINHIFLTVVFVFVLSEGASSAPIFQEVASGHDISEEVRPAIANNGNVAFIAGVGRSNVRIVIERTGSLNDLEFASFGLDFFDQSTLDHGGDGKLVQLRDEGDVVFLSQKTVPSSTCPSGRKQGIYGTDTTGLFLLPLLENCFEFNEAAAYPKSDISMSANGTVAFSSITNGNGAVYRGPVAGPITELRKGGLFFNTGSLDVNNAGRVTVQMEYTDNNFADTLNRGVLLFDSVNQENEDVDVAIEKMGIGDQPALAINASGQVALSLDEDAIVRYIDAGGSVVSHTIEAGVYIATPNPFNSALNNPPTNLVKIADTTGDYCKFGNVDINDDGRVVFEARLDDGAGDCTDVSDRTYDGIFMGEDSVFDRVVTRGDDELGDHEFFDSVRLGELNNQGQVTFLSTYSEPLVDPTKVWRVDLNRLDNQRFWESFFSLIWTWFFSWWG